MGGIDYVPEKFTFRVKKYDYTDPDFGECDNKVEYDDNTEIKRDEY